jgi:two-component system sensor histidine kinase MprB
VLQGVRLDLVVHRVCDRANERHDKRAIQVSTRPVVVIGDEDALERAVSNLIDNAITWTPPDGRV